MKKVTAFVGTATKRFTLRAVQQFADNLQAFGDVECEIVPLKDYRIENCRGCQLCFDKGEERCPLKDDRDLLIRKIKASDGVVFATPNYSFQISGMMKTFLDRLGYAFHRPQFFGKAFTNIVTQGFFRGGEIVKYLDFVGFGLGFNTVKGSCLKTLAPMPQKAQRKFDKAMVELAQRFHKRLANPFPAPGLIKLMIFSWSRMSMLARERDTRDYAYYSEKGWFDSDYFYPIRSGALKKTAGHLFDSIAKRISKGMVKQAA